MLVLCYCSSSEQLTARTSSLRLMFSLVAVEATARTATARRLRPPATGLAARAVGTATLLASACIVTVWGWGGGNKPWEVGREWAAAPVGPPLRVRVDGEQDESRRGERHANRKALCLSHAPRITFM